MTVPIEPVRADEGSVIRGATARLSFLVLASVIEAILDRSLDSFSDGGCCPPPHRVRYAERS